ncbi:39S ribosomal protein L38, mitochondrial-like [Amphibalanus amphitrite]|uniref:39S ribosomal protein L38, mitochondrial-like n=1 Tax=Amphibalanus amphitrite TaxID=1232801 RepID=UPI001C917829|nr:39S ribosomal protein L38, mitochondrial-like [Amphibalanus amphitrite]
MSHCLWRLPQPVRLIVQQQVRGRLKLRGRPPGDALSLEERLRRLAPPAAPAVNIGFQQRPAPSRIEYTDVVRRNRSDAALERAARDRQLRLPLADVQAEFAASSLGPEHARNVAEHYSVMEGLFGAGAFFTPVLPLRVAFATSAEEEAVVHLGNAIKPAEALTEPEVTYAAPEDSLWTLLCTNLEGSLSGDAPEVLHWLVTDIPGGAVLRGRQLRPYLQPLPFRGTGYHRLAFVLFKQDGPLPEEAPQQSGDVLESRGFSTEEFYRRHEERLTPAGLAFFQSDWDSSVTEFFHRQLERREPVFEYDFPQPYIRRQRWFPKGESVVHYFDKYADPRDLQKQMLLKRLAMVDPFEGVREGPKYPLAVPKKRGQRPPTWVINEQRKEARKISKYYYIDRRPETVFDPSC